MDYKEINDYLVGIFNNVLIIEEASLKTSRFKDVSIKEMHTIDEIGNRENATPSDIAKALMVTLGTVTTSLNRLEQKGYITDGFTDDEFDVLGRGLKNLNQFLEDLK